MYKVKVVKGSLHLGLVDGPSVPHIGNSSFLHLQRRERPLLAKEGDFNEFYQHLVIHCRCWGLLHAPKLGHGADYLTSPPKESMLRIFPSEKSNGVGRDRTRELGNQRPAC
jgi:hypothetical protein